MSAPLLQRDPWFWAVLVLFGLAFGAWCYRVINAWLLRHSQRRLAAIENIQTASAPVPSLRPASAGQQPSRLRRHLQLLGWTSESAYTYCLMMSAVVGVCTGLLGAALMIPFVPIHSIGQGLLAGVVLLGLSALGAALPRLVLSRWADHAQGMAQRHVANALNLLGMSLLSGMGLSQALTQIVPVLDEQSAVLGRAFRAVSLMLEAGAPMAHALPELERHIEMPELHALIGNLVQSDQLGTPLAEILQHHAQAIRSRQQLAVQSRSAKVATWLILPLVFCQLPALLLIMVGPSVLDTLRILQGLAR